MDHTKRCPYDTLGVAKDASTKDIKAAFRRLSLETHPDVAGSGANAERFKQISHAASILTNDKNRRAYDSRVQGGGPFAPAFHRNSEPAGFRRPSPHTRAPRPAAGSFTAVLDTMFRPRNLILGPIALFATVSAVQYALGIDNSKQIVEGRNDEVKAWKNPETGRYETPAPWDPVYRKLKPTLESVPRNQVTTRSR